MGTENARTHWLIENWSFSVARGLVLLVGAPADAEDRRRLLAGTRPDRLHRALPQVAASGDQLVRLDPPLRGDPQLQQGYVHLGLAGLKGIQVDCQDRKSTRLNSSHSSISYAVFFFKR